MKRLLKAKSKRTKGIQQKNLFWKVCKGREAENALGTESENERKIKWKVLVASLQPSLFLFERLMPTNRNAFHHTSQSAAFLNCQMKRLLTRRFCSCAAKNRQTGTAAWATAITPELACRTARISWKPNCAMRIKWSKLSLSNKICKTSTMKKHLKRLLSEERKERKEVNIWEGP